MADFVYDPQHLSPGKPYYRLRVATNPSTGAILGEVDVDLIAPDQDGGASYTFSGFELPARDALSLAQARATEAGVEKILVVDRYGLLLFGPAVAGLGAGL